MFSTGSGSHDGSNYPTQWALNPSAYQNVANDQVDWAALAQQWIMMKETAPPEHQMPQAPPPPNIGSSKKDVIDEGGEAPMDVDNEKEENDWNDTAGSGQDWNDWQQNSWSWGSNWNGPSGVPPPNSVNSSSKSALLPTPFSHYSAQNIESNSNLDYQNASSNDFNSGYWTNNSGGSRNKGPSKQRMTRKGPMASENRIDNSSESVTLDAAKRRQLPAWIREGLEKMEREKLKQIERERERVEREVYLTRKKEETEGAIKLLQASGLPVKSKFDSDSEDSSSEHEVRTKKTPSPERSHSPPPMSEEQRMQQRMLMVRRAMTEVLLEVTSSEIEIICQEELIRFRSRHSASAKKMAQYGTPGVGSTNDSLGLGMYGGESESSSDESDSDQPPNSVSNDSDTQLKETIKRRRAEFAKTERDIENRLNKDKESKTSSGDKSDGAQTPEWPDSGGERDHSQVDTAQTHGSGPLKSRRHSQKSSSRTPPRKDQKSTPDSRDSRQKSKKQSSSSSNSDSEESSCSESSSSTSSHETRRKEIRTSRRGRSRSTETDKSRKKNNHSRSVSNASDSDDRSHSRHRDRSYSSRRSDRSRRDRERDSRRERSRTRSRTRRSRSRSRERVQRVRRTRSRSRSRSSRRRRSRSQSDRRRDHRSPHGGKRTRR